MSDVTIKQLAKVLGKPVDTLLAQLGEAGMQFSDPDQVISSTEKVKLLGFLRRTHGKKGAVPDANSVPRQVTLSRRTVSEIKVNPGQRGAATKTVNVEVRQKRTYVKRSAVEVDAQADSERAEALRKLEESRSQREAEQMVLLETDRKRKEEEARQREAEEARKLAEEEKRRSEEEARRKALEEAAASAPAPVEAGIPAAVPVEPPARDAERPKRSEDRHARGKPKHASHRMRDELHLTPEGAARRTGRKKVRSRTADGARGSTAHGFSKPTVTIKREVAVGDSIIVADLAQKLAVKGADVVKALFKMGVMTTINQAVDHDTAVLVAEELGHTVVRAVEDDAETVLEAHKEQEGERAPRPPVVTIMGHVDHGKTSLLDYIRRAKVASGEAGGITQHIGAYHVETDKGVVTFLDTPGHAAFSSMRARGAQSTDIVVLVVAADDGVMPQTIEAIQHARAANVPIIVAMNKMDKPEANPDNIKQGLVQQEVVPEDWGGDVQFVPVSAKTGDGVDALLDAILVQAEVLELTAVPDGRASGAVIESSLDKGRGPVATVLVQQGLLRKGDFLVCGVEFGRVRALFDENGRQVEEAGPSIPVQLLGLSGVPETGDDFVVVADERLAKEVAQERQHKRRESRLVQQAGNRMEDIMAQMGQGEGQLSLNLVIKADVQGSVQALREALVGMSNDQIRINVIVSGVGGITESDANQAAASKATIIGFNVRADASARKVIEAYGLDLRYFSIIYDVIDQVKQVASGLLGNEIREEIIGTAEVRDVFRSSKFGAIAGCMVVEGSVKRNKPIRVLRDNTVIFEGELESLRRFKENVEEVKSGSECGIGVKQYNDVKPGDQIECFERIEVARTL
jgi:translation initiation factor IF-2